MKHPEETATIERELRAVDAALREGAPSHGDPVARQLQELALALRADSPAPDAAFAKELGRRVQTGFARDDARVRQDAALKRLSGRNARRRRFNLLPVAGVVTPLLLIAVTVIALGGPPRLDSNDDEASSGGGSGGGSAAPAPAPAPEVSARQSGADRALSAPPPDAPGFAPQRRQRRVERSVAMTLSAPDDEIPAVADGVNRVVARNGGFVLRSELDTNEDGSTGSFELRLPVNRLQGALGQLARLASVSSQSQRDQDITRGYVKASDRLQAARAERRNLLRRLEGAATDAEVKALREQLDLVAAEVNGLLGRLRGLRLRTDYAVVSVDLIGEEGGADPGGAAGSFDDAVGDAGDLLVGFAGVLIRVLAIALPLSVIAGLGWLATNAMRRRRRESVLA